jgi:hypothetical protein
MGVDYQFVAYPQPALSDAALCELLRAHAPEIELVRHARSSVRGRLCVIASYDRLGGGRQIAIDAPKVHPDASLTEVVQAAWKAMRGALQGQGDDHGTGPTPLATGTDEDDDLLLRAFARELSRTTKVAIWMCRGDHAGIGGYARFEAGSLVARAGDDTLVVGADHRELCDKLWRRDAGTRTDPDAMFDRTFPPEGDPPVLAPADPDLRIPFDPAHHELSLE